MGLPIRESKVATDALAIPYVSAVRVLGIIFCRIITATSTKTWSGTVHWIKYKANESYFRTFSLIQRIRIASTLLLSRIWYHTQILPISQTHARQVNSIFSLFATLVQPSVCTYRQYGALLIKWMQILLTYKRNATPNILADVYT